MSLLLLVLSAFALSPGAAPVPELQLVESVPAETSLDDPEFPEAAEVWLQMIGAARSNLDISQFYIAVEGDPLMESVLVAVEQAADRGVAVRIIADAKFANTYPEPLARLEAHAGIELRRYDMKPLTGGVQHAKYFLVDGQQVFLGSQNWDWRALSHIQELGLVTSEPGAVNAYQQVFDLDWALAGGEASQAGQGTPVDWVTMVYQEQEVRVLPVASPQELLPHDSMWDLPQLLALIDGAEQQVRVQVLSYELVGYSKEYWDELDRALRRADARGVQVQIIVSNWTKRSPKLEGLASLTVLPNTEVRFVNIPEASTGFIPFGRVVHSKFLVVDGQRGWVGTSNWSKDYFFASRNLGLVVQGAAFAEDLDRRFLSTWDSEYAEVLVPGKEYQAPRRR